jgi:hypothetical protein
MKGINERMRLGDEDVKEMISPKRLNLCMD